MADMLQIPARGAGNELPPGDGPTSSVGSRDNLYKEEALEPPVQHVDSSLSCSTRTHCAAGTQPVCSAQGFNVGLVNKAVSGVSGLLSQAS